MGYTTEFEGRFEISPPLSPEHRTYLAEFARTRRMRRGQEFQAGIGNREVPVLKDPVRESVGLPWGIQGEFCVAGPGYRGQDRDPSIEDYNYPPGTQPGLWCQWVPTEDGSSLVWDGGEKFYFYTEWLEYMIKNFFIPWGYVLNGAVKYAGEDSSDRGRIDVKNNKIGSLTAYSISFRNGVRP